MNDPSARRHDVGFVRWLLRTVVLGALLGLLTFVVYILVAIIPT